LNVVSGDPLSHRALLTPALRGLPNQGCFTLKKRESFMSSIDEYEREFRGHVQAAEERLAHASRSSSPDDRRTALSGAERAAEAGKDVVQLMELEGRSLSGAARSKLQAQLRSYRDEISALKTRIKDLKSTARSPDHCREENCAGGDSYSNPSPGERSRLLANNDRMSKATDKLKQAHAVTLDMEQTANAILGDLGKQRETLMHAQGSLRYAADGLEGSRKLLAQMGRRAAMNKMTLWIVIGLVRASLNHSLLSNHAQRSPCLFPGLRAHARFPVAHALLGSQARVSAEHLPLPPAQLISMLLLLFFSGGSDSSPPPAAAAAGFTKTSP
jgi:vesicle transport through interaction with t-SNAREs protein 1